MLINQITMQLELYSYKTIQLVHNMSIIRLESSNLFNIHPRYIPDCLYMYASVATPMHMMRPYQGSQMMGGI